MLERKTVFVLGAGASAPYGFPVGADLAAYIIKGLAAEGKLRQRLLRAEFRAGDLDDFRSRLRSAGGTSIDFFLEGQDEETVAIGKAAIALEIRQAERNCREKEWLIDPIDEDGDNWLKYVWGLMRPGCTAGNIAATAKVSFVTFNYDRTVEQYFDMVLRSNFNLQPVDAAKLRAEAIEIIHLHGAIPDAFQFGSFGPDSALRAREASQGLLLINDKAGPEPGRLTRARMLFHESALIVLIGFGFHRANIERLAFEQIPPAVTVLGSVYGMGRGQIDRASALIKRSWTAGDQRAKAETFLKQSVDLR